jgi:hypothetical protein
LTDVMSPIYHRDISFSTPFGTEAAGGTHENSIYLADGRSGGGRGHGAPGDGVLVEPAEPDDQHGHGRGHA